METIVLATSNQGKCREIQAILSPLTINCQPQSEYGIGAVEETGLSFVENALIKARHASKQSELPAIADDSGLVVPALGGRPGIYSSRYGGENADDNDNIDKLLSSLVGESRREAYFYCAMAYVRHPADPTPLIACGRWDGRILEVRRGADGFGYDPIFYLPVLEKTAAELGRDEKNHISHRAKALQQLLHMMEYDDD